ncbi:hypothetical protein [Anaerosporobacter faecicola]|uniref:hypothetical protein n=1 Tax=Anaerosporobacter faecicola TaxID=2718714 RepID=UPI00143C9471|nr:hypothetical protein [Anaerosporobacter faecicola]
MKKSIFVFLSAVMILIFIGCSSKNRNKYNSISNYHIYENEYTAYNEEDKPFIVNYVQISGLGNDRLEDKINQTLKESITEWINVNCKWLEKSKISVKCKTSKYLSICYTVESKNSNGEEFESDFIRFGITIDLKTGDRVYLDDIVKEVDRLKEELTNYDYGNEVSPPIDTDEADEIIELSSISEKEYLEKMYITDPYVYDYMYSYIKAKPSFYVVDKQLVITRDEKNYNDIFIDFK